MNFDHTLRDRDLVVERYLARQLSETEAAAFEEHYLDCPDCLDQLETVRGLRRALVTVAAEDAARPAFPRRSWALAAAVLLAALAPALWLGLDARRLAGELAETRDRLVAAEARVVDPERIAGLERELGERRAEVTGLADDRRRLTALLDRERAPQVNTPLVPLSALRAGAGEAATVRVVRPSGAGRLILALAVGPQDNGPFVATLRQAGRELWRSEGLRPDALGDVRVSFHRELLPPGEYSVSLDLPAGRSAGRYAFRVEPGPGDGN